MAENRTYNGNCHCGKFRFTISIPPLGSEPVMRCDCSSCMKNGYHLVYPKASDVVFTHGSRGELTEYRTGSKTRPHLFCSTCGSSVMIDLTTGDAPHMRDRMAVNVRAAHTVPIVLLSACAKALL